MSQSFQTILKSGTPKIPFVDLDDAPVAFDSALVFDLYNHGEPNPEQSSKSGNTNQVIYIELTNTFGPKQISIHATGLF